MTTPMRTILPAALAVALLASACSKDAEKAKPAATTQPAAKTVVNTPEVATARQRPEPMPTSDIPERVTRLISTPVQDKPKGAISKTRLDVSSPDAFVQSLQVIERESSKENVDDFRAALTIMQLQTQHKISQIAAGSPTPPQFTDQQLMEIAFAEIQGMTLDQVVAHARKVAPAVLPQQQ